MSEQSDSMNILWFSMLLIMTRVYRITKLVIPDHFIVRLLVELGIFTVLWFAIKWINQPFTKIVARYRLKDYHVFVAGLIVLFVYALWQ